MKIETKDKQLALHATHTEKKPWETKDKQMTAIPQAKKKWETKHKQMTLQVTQTEKINKSFFLSLYFLANLN